MGNCLVFRRRRTRRHIVLILIGLDNAGKTKTVNNLAGEKDDGVMPTVGFKAVNLVHRDTPVTIYDLGGGPEFRQIWPQYYSEVHGVIFVIDSSDFSRLEECKVVLEEVLSHDKISGKPVLVLANKQDKSGALDDIDVVEKLDIEPLVNRYRCPTLVESYSAVPVKAKKRKPKIDPGLRKGYLWLLNYISRRYGDINLRVQTDIHADLERRKRLASKAANRASQTFTAVSDDIATQTGFENPNYQMPKSPEPNRVKELETQSDVIVVKPVRNSIDTTITIESLESDVTSKAKPKLSPLFGRSSKSSGPTEVKIELEPRSEFRKLSPIVRNKSSINQHIDFKNRPQSSPSLNEKKIKTEPSSKDTTIQEDELQVDAAGSGDGERTRESVIARMATDIGLMNDKDLANKTAYSDVVAPVSNAAPLAAETVRPASASQLVRRQLELGPHHQRRRLSLRYIQRNRTSPEHLTLSVFETSAKAPRRQLDKGDYERAATIK